ncbi:MAG: hypothetical protein JWR04_1514 [Rhodoglobus sp.]|nr:hypothetical protein [Rhodoglobus sp.]
MPGALRFGVVGTGPWARAVHIPAAAASPRIVFAGVLGRDAARTAAAVEGTTAAPFVELAGFLDGVDIVGLAVPPETQVELAEAAVLAGKHVLLEKPVAVSPDAATALAELAEARGIRSLVFFTHLFSPDFAAWAERARADGPWTHGRAESYSSTLVDSASVFHGSAWRHERGALWDVGPHAVAQLCAVLGPVASVLARRGEGDFATLILEHEAGAVSTVSLAADLPVAIPGGTSLLGPRGRTSPPAIADWNATARLAYTAALAQLADEIENGAEAHECDLMFGAHVTRVLAAAERSAASTRPEIP